MMGADAFSLARIPLGDWVEAGVEWMGVSWAAFFDGMADGITALVEGLDALLSAPPYFVLIVLLAALAWYVRNGKFALYTVLSFLLIESMDLWSAAMSTLSLVLISTLVSLVVGVLLGMLAAAHDGFSKVLKPILDFMQTLPSFVYLIPAIVFFGIGFVPGAIATIIFSLPPAARLTELGLRNVDAEVIEAGEAFGASSWRILWDIKVPLALPTIMSGINQVIMLSLSMVVTAGIVGSGGLGSIVYQGVTRLEIGLGFEGGIAVVIVAVFLDRLTSALGERANHRISRG
jgi:ABC-type proline/glycine betaine transport system permease subunit